MKRWTLYGILLLVCCCTGCLYTLNPLFTAKDLRFDPRLLGTWNTGEDKVIVTVATKEDLAGFPKALQALQARTYKIRSIEGQSHIESQYLCFLVVLGKEYYMDLYPLERHPSADVLRAMVIPGHKFFKVKLQDKNIELRDLDDEFLEEEIRQKKVSIAHLTRSDGTILVTAPTAELQQYVLKYTHVTAAFKHTPAIWNR